MNICFVSSGFGLGGVERVVTLIGESLRTRENNVYYFSIENTKPYWSIPKENFHIQNKQYGDIGRLSIRGLKLLELCIHGGQYNVNRYQHQFITSISEYIVKKNINVLVLTSAHQIATIPILKNKFKNLKIIAWIHQSHQAIQGIADKFFKYFVLGIEAADTVICLTGKTCEYFKNLNKRTIKIFNPISIIGKGQIAQLTAKNVSFTSRIAFIRGEKGLDLLIKIATALPNDININIAGSGSSKDEYRLKRLIKKNNIESKLNWNGPKKGEQLISHYLDSSVFISTSRTEAFSLVILEAMSLGLPIIASNTIGAHELLDGGKYGILVDPLDVRSFVKQISSLLENREKLNTYQKLSLQRSRDFELEKIVDEWQDMLNSLSNLKNYCVNEL